MTDSTSDIAAGPHNSAGHAADWESPRLSDTQHLFFAHPHLTGSAWGEPVRDSFEERHVSGAFDPVASTEPHTG